MQLSHEINDVIDPTFEYTRMKVGCLVECGVAGHGSVTVRALQLALTTTVANLVTRDLNTSHARVTQRLAAVDALVAVLKDAGAVYIAEGCPVAVAVVAGRGKDSDAPAPAPCVDPPTLQYLVQLAAEYQLRGGFSLAYPLTRSDPDVDQLVRTAAR